MRVAGATVPHDDYMSPAEGREMGAGEIEDYLAGGELSAEALDSLSYKRWLSTDSEADDATYSYSYEDDSVDDTTITTPAPTLSFSPTAVPTAAPQATHKPTPFGVSLDSASVRQVPSAMLPIGFVGAAWVVRELFSELW